MVVTLAFKVFVPVVPDRVIEEGGAWLPTAPPSQTEPLPAVMVMDCPALTVASIVRLKLMVEDVAAVEVKVVFAAKTTGVP